MLYTFEIHEFSSSCSVNLRSALKIKNYHRIYHRQNGVSNSKIGGNIYKFLIKMIKCLKTDCSFNSSISFHLHSFSTHNI